MLKKLSALVTGVALSLGTVVVGTASAQAEEALPPAPVVSIKAPTTPQEKNLLVVTGVDSKLQKNYRYVIRKGDKALKQLNKKEREKLYAGTLSVEELAKGSKEVLNAVYSAKDVSVDVYLFNDKRFEGQWIIVNMGGVYGIGESTLDKAVKLGQTGALTITDPATTAPAAPERLKTPPTVTATIALSAAQCVNNVAVDNKLTITGETAANLRFVGTLDGQSILLKTELRDKLLKSGELTLADLQAAYPNYTVTYGKELQVQMYWFDQETKYHEDLYTKVTLTVGTADRFIKIGEPKKVTLVDKATLKCDPPITTPPVVEAKLNLVPAQCVNKVVEDNKLTITGKTMPNLRFVGTVDGKSVLLKTELRDKLLKDGQLTLADLQAAYPKFPIPYGKELQVQMYWFDQERAYAETLYNNPVLAAGNATRFIKLGDPVKITLVDKATVKCQDVKPADETKPNVVVPGPKKPEAKKPALPQTGGTAGSSAALAGLALVAGVALVAARRQHS
ncbi:MAG: LPXTG cell wall anchor domain-containing protein [Actinomycetaceae bacterium]|nr:LPXTG cell wall anchor domain-containing protein [Actinomycetaceae bacterium]